MDPKSIANLDPKLRETYERVMGTSSPAAPSMSPENQAAPLNSTPMSTDLSAPPATPVAPPPDFSTPVSPEPQLSSTLSSPTSSQATGAAMPAAATAYSPADLGLSAASQPSPGGMQQPLSSPATVAQTGEGTSSVVKFLYIFGGIVFFIVYVFFWIKIFDYQLPF